MRPEENLPPLPVRNNNPLNVKLGGATIKWVQSGDAEVGGQALDGGRFLKFKDPQTGFQAAQDLLFNSYYRRMDLESAMRTWSGGGYGAEVASKLPKDKRLSELNDQERQYLVQSMSQREGFAKTPSAPVIKPAPAVVSPFNDLARQLDPMLPKADYDALREKYFRDHIMPYTPPMALASSWEDFKSNTERPSTLGVLGRTRLQVALATANMSKALVAPASFLPQGKKLYDSVVSDEQDLEKIAAREGVNPTASSVVGNLVGASIPIGLAATAFGPLAESVIGMATGSARTIALASRAMRGGLAFATYEAGSDQEGNRLMAGARGFAYGAAGDLLLGMPAFLKARGLATTLEEAKTLSTAAMEGKPIPPEADKAAAEYLQNQQGVVRKEGRPNLFLEPNSKRQGVYAIVETKDGQTIPFQVLAGKEDMALNAVAKVLDRGGALDTLAWDPDNHARGVKFLKQLANQHGVKYDENLLIRTNQATPPEELVKTLAEKDIPAEVKANGVVSVPTTNIDVPKTEVKPTTLEELPPTPAEELEGVKAINEASLTGTQRRLLGEQPKMSWGEAALLVRRLGRDPATADLEAIRYMGEPELNRLFETVQRQRELRVGPEASVAEEAVRKGELNPQLPQGRMSDWVPVARREGFSMMPTGRNMGATFYYVEPGANEGIALRGKVLTATNKVDALLQLGMPEEEVFSYTGYDPGDYAVKEYGPKGILQLFREGKISYHTTDRADRPLIQLAKEKGYDFVRLIKEPSDRGVWEELLHLKDRNTSLQHVFPIVGNTPHPRGELGAPIIKHASRLDMDLASALGLNPEEYKAYTSYVQEMQGQEVKTKPGKLTVVVPRTLMSKITNVLGIPEAEMDGLTWSKWQDALRDLRVPFDKATAKKMQIPNSPLVVFREGVDRNTVYHEGIHANMVNAELNPMEHISKGMRVVATEIARGLGSNAGYSGMRFPQLVDEAFTWGAEGIRFGDQRVLNKLAGYDRSVDHVYQFMNDTARNLLGASYAKLDSPGVRIFQRRLNDLINRTDEAIFQRVKNYPELDSLDFEPEASTWTLRQGRNALKFQTLNEMWDHVLEHDINDYTADPTFWAQARGVRGPFIPPNTNPPGKNLPLPDFPLAKPGEGLGTLAITGWFRPFLSWAASLDRRIRPQLLAKNVQFPLFERVKAVDDAVRAGDQFLSHYTEKWGDQLMNITHEKQPTVFELLTHDPANWENMANKLRLGPDEVKAATEIAKIGQDFTRDTGINLNAWWREYYPRLKANAWQPDTVPGWGLLKNTKAMGFWEKSVTTDTIDPSDNHLGRFLKWAIGEGWKKKFTGTPLAELQKLVDLKTSEGTYVLGPTRWPLQNYVRYMKGIPDASGQAINKAIGDFQGFLVNRFKEINKYLPEGAKLPEEFSAPGQVMNKLLLLSYAGGLALRPAVTLRDFFQMFTTGMPVVGGSTLMKGLGRALTREGWNFAEQSGALLRKTNIGEMYGDVFNELPLPERGKMATAMKWSQKLLGPSRWGNNLARAGVFNGVFDDAVKAVEDFQAGRIDQGKFLQNSHLWFTDDQVYSKLMTRAMKETPGNVAKDIALELVDHTQWAYRRGTQPAMLRTGLGRLFGQYGMWPLNYMDFSTRLGKKYAMFPEQARRSVATWAAVNYAAYKAMEGAGVDTGKWLFTSPAAYTGGPQLDLVKDLMQSWETTDQGASARARVLRYPLNFVPGIVSMRAMITALENQEDLNFGGKGFMRMMGFKPLPDVEKDQDLTDWALEESGITANPQRGR